MCQQRMKLLRTRQGFLERGLAFEVAEVTKDLSSVLQQRGELEELEQIALETSVKIEQMHPSAEALASLQEIQQAILKADCTLAPH